jgi:accessory colonization factor AcfC
MTVTEILKSVQFVVDQDGKPTAALLNMSAWEAFLSMLEDIEDAQLIRDRIKNWRSKEGWTRWEDFEAELEADGLSTLD